MNEIINKYQILTLGLLVTFTVLLIIPLLGIFFRFDFYDLGNLFKITGFSQIILQSLYLSLCVSAISVSTALVISFLIREQMPIIQQVFIVCFTIPILIPTISLGMGLLFLFSRSGPIFYLFGWRPNIFGFNGLLLGMVLYTLPFAVLQIFDTLRYEDSHLHSEAKALRLSILSRLRSISLPRVKSAVKRAFFASFLISFTDFGINMMVGGQYRTLSLTLYQEIIGRMNFNRAAIISILMWIPLLLLFLFCMKGSVFNFKLNERGTTSAFYLKKKGVVISCIILAILAIILLLPIGTFIASSFRPTNLHNPDTLQNYKSLLNLNLTRYLKNSLIIATFGAVLGTIFSCLTAYVASKMNTLSAKFIKFIAVIPFSIPGLVIGLGLVLSYSSYDILFSTFIALICANIINFFGIPYFLFLNNFSLISNEVEISAKVFRMNWLNVLSRIYLPQMKQTIVSSMLFYFTNSMITISAAIILFRSQTMPLAILITQFEAQLLIFKAASVTAIILFVNIIFKLIFYIYFRQKAEERYI